MVGRPLDPRGEKDHASVKNGINITGIEIAKSYARRQLITVSSTPKSTKITVTSRKLKRGGIGSGLDEDSRSVGSVQSEMNIRHSIAGSSVRDDESIDSSLSVPSYMAQMKSAKAISRGQSLLGPISMEKELGVKKRLSFPGPPVPGRPRRHSGPPKLQSSISMVI